MSNKPIRGTLQNVSLTDLEEPFKRLVIVGHLKGHDPLAGQDGRNTLLKGCPVITSNLESLSVNSKGKIIAETRFSQYVIEGSIKINQPVNSMSKSLGG